MIQKFGLLMIMATTLVGCASMTSIAPIAPQVSARDFPVLDMVVTREVGETMVEQENIKTYRAAHFEQDVKYELVTAAISYKTGVPYVADQRLNGKPAYCGQGSACGGFNNCVENLQVCFMKGKSPSEIEILGKFGTEVITIPPDLIRYDEVAAVKNAGFRRHLIYTGKSGSILHLVYREFINDLARPAFSQDLNFDLSEGRVIGFKGAQFEIAAATNTTITYKMITGFPDRTDPK